VCPDLTINIMEMKARMSKRVWLLGLAVLISIGLLVACGSNYNSASDGLVLVGSQGSNQIQTFSFNLNSGHASGIGNPPATSEQPAAIVVEPSGAYAYVIVGKAIQAFKVNSGGTLSASGDSVSDPNPVAMSMDAAGKFLFVAEGNSGALVDVYAIGSGGALTLVPGNFTFPSTAVTPTIVAVAATPTVFPPVGINGVQNAVCSVPENNPPSSQYLYALDSTNYVVWQFTVDTSTGALGNPLGTVAVPSFETEAVPAGIAVDPCDRFVYVSGSLHNKISAYTICTAVSQLCPLANGALLDVPGSPFALAGSANGAGPLVVDPFGNNVYVLGTLSNTVSPLKISPISGALTAMSPATIVTGSQPKSIAIRADDNWLFVTNYTSANVSQYSVTPATGALNAEAPIDTETLPFGVAVK